MGCAVEPSRALHDRSNIGRRRPKFERSNPPASEVTKDYSGPNRVQGRQLRVRSAQELAYAQWDGQIRCVALLPLLHRVEPTRPWDLVAYVLIRCIDVASLLPRPMVDRLFRWQEHSFPPMPRLIRALSRVATKENRVARRANDVLLQQTFARVQIVAYLLNEMVDTRT